MLLRKYWIAARNSRCDKMFRLFKRKDPICGMKEEKGKGVEKYGKWFCSQNDLKEYEKQVKGKKQGGGCCG